MRHQTRRRVTVVMTFGMLCASATSIASAADCTLASLQSIAPADTTVVTVQLVPAAAPLPEYCQVNGLVSTPGNTVNFRLGLPTAWNGKFYFQGNGAFAGTIPAVTAGLVRGYASVSTDTGHQANGFDASWALNNRPKEIDYGYRAVHVTAVASKSITAAYYATVPNYAYFFGCSNAGRQALMEAQRYPADFDGIIVGAPALHWTGNFVDFNWNQRALLSAQDNYIPESKLPIIAAAVVANCDGDDGLVDGLVDDPRQCTFDPVSLQCPAGDAPDCLTAGQIETLKKIHGGPRASAGKHLFPGFAPGGENGPNGWPLWTVGTASPSVQADGTLVYPASPLPPRQFLLQDQFLKYMAFDDPAFDWRTFDFDTDPQRLRFMAQILDATDPNLSPFKALGGKMIMYHGWSDAVLTPYRTIRYLRSVVRAIGSKTDTDDFLRLFMAPGMHHCNGGPGPNTFDTLTALENWVENGIAPERLIASHLTGGVVDRTRPLCPYPQVARYLGAGSIDEADNFACVYRKGKPPSN